MHLLWFMLPVIRCVFSLDHDAVSLAVDYFYHKRVPYICYLSCEGVSGTSSVARKLQASVARVSVSYIAPTVGGYLSAELGSCLVQRYSSVGVLLHGVCECAEDVLQQASRLSLFDSTHVWLVLDDDNHGTLRHFHHLNLSVDADVALATYEGDHYRLADVFNFGTIQGSTLETQRLGTWDSTGLSMFLSGFKYYHRWDFHNLTLRAVSVIRNPPSSLDPSVLWRRGHNSGVSYITTVAANLLNAISEQHNFRFNYTIAGRWVGSPGRNSTLAVTNSLFWRQQDLSFTSMRITLQWLHWVEPFFPPVTTLETKFYYLVKQEGVGSFENRFVTPLSMGAWACTGASAAAAAFALATAAAKERRPQPFVYAVVSVVAAFCQQGFEDGVQVMSEFSSQSRRISLLVVGLCSLLVYNYYTSSVVSWLLSAAPPTLASVDQLAAAPLQLAFDDVGYTRGWLDEGRFYYYSGWKNPKEDALRTKALQAPRTLPLLMPVEQGIELVRTGEVAYHAEPLEALRVLARRCDQRELCALAALQMMPPSHVYVMGPPRSPYKQFFVWSMLRLLERGVTSNERRRVAAAEGRCEGQTPRALALGQAAPALVLLGGALVVAVGVLIAEILHHRYRG